MKLGRAKAFYLEVTANGVNMRENQELICPALVKIFISASPLPKQTPTFSRFREVNSFLQTYNLPINQGHLLFSLPLLAVFQKRSRHSNSLAWLPIRFVSSLGQQRTLHPNSRGGQSAETSMMKRQIHQLRPHDIAGGRNGWALRHASFPGC
ncbi:hypothetical protein BGX38DRAFT_747332 [Terfezia claveryi]|nr:hypothetical protein BGX38DRAFT_747332 [Terfezia claveryi]